MQLQLASFRSTVARRLFLLFAFSALVPIAVLACLAWFRIGDELRRAGQARIRDAALGSASSLMERAGFLSSIAASEWRSQPSPWRSPVRRFSLEQLPAEVAEPIRADLESGLIPGVFVTTSGGDGKPGIQLIFEGGTRGRYLAREVNIDYLVWGAQGPDLRAGRDLYLVDRAGRVVYASAEGTPLEHLALGSVGRSGYASLQDTGEALSVGFLQLPVRYGDLKIAITEPERRQLAALRSFRSQVLIVLAIALFLSLLAATTQIRRRLAPLENLERGTRELAAGRLGARVEIKSGDEFEQLGSAFNEMAQSLQHQFKLVGSLGDIGSAVLSRLEPEGIVGGVLAQLGDVVPCRAGGVVLLADDLASALTSWQQTGERGSHTRVFPLPAADGARLDPTAACEVFSPGEGPVFLRAVAGDLRCSVHAFPIALDGELTGAIAVAVDGGLDAAAAGRLRRVADQVGVALANARLVGRLDRMSRGTIQALARAVDAKSPWTAGHSERVAELGRRIGAALGVSAEEQEVLYRGGLLHDIGKIGVPAAVLDKMGKLTPEERAMMERHPELGVRILEPIHELSDVLPIVWEHHEWFDGSGYPRRLAGDQLSLHGRIFAVADVYDALRSDRPYRAGMSLDRVLALMASEVGSHFDPLVHRAFLLLMPELRHEAQAQQPTLVAGG